MLTIPSADLVGAIGDALHFTTPDKDDPNHSLQLRWDGGQFHAGATDTIRVAVSSWSPDDQPDTDVQDELGVELGSDDDPWQFVLAVDDAKHLLSIAKPIKGREYLPLSIVVDGDQMSVRRPKQTRVPGFSVTYETLPSQYTLPDLAEVIVAAATHTEPVKEIWFNASMLADFGKVRQRGHAAKFTFGGAIRPTIVEIGERFVGAIMPCRVGNETPDVPIAGPVAEQASDGTHDDDQFVDATTTEA